MSEQERRCQEETARPQFGASEVDRVTARIGLLREDLERLKARFPYMDRSSIGLCEVGTAPRYRARGHDVRFVFSRPLSAEDVATNNRITQWLNECFVVRLHAVLESSGVVHSKRPLDESLPGHAEVRLVRKLRNAIGHGSAEYNERDPRDRGLWRELQRVCHLNDVELPAAGGKLPLPIDRVIDPLVEGCISYTRALAFRSGETQAEDRDAGRELDDADG